MAGMNQSISRIEKYIDSGPMEGFWGILKCEKYYLQNYNTYEDRSKAIDKYIIFYNNKRFQEKLNDLSPLEFRALAA